MKKTKCLCQEVLNTKQIKYNYMKIKNTIKWKINDTKYKNRKVTNSKWILYITHSIDKLN
jgi:hypothetical protein